MDSCPPQDVNLMVVGNRKRSQGMGVHRTGMIYVFCISLLPFYRTAITVVMNEHRTGVVG